jgi:hypothetical protein
MLRMRSYLTRSQLNSGASCRTRITMPNLSDDPKERASEEKALANIDRYGLHVMKVMGDNEWPEFTYSVGLYQTFGLPEIIILGLRTELAHSILNELANRGRRGERFRTGDTLQGLLEGFPVQLRPVRDEHIEPHFGWGRWFYDGRAFPVLQLVWPTTSGVWPWEDRATEEFRRKQPLLETADVPAWARSAS